MLPDRKGAASLTRATGQRSLNARERPPDTGQVWPLRR